MSDLTERLSDEEVAEFADFPYTPAERRLAREVQELRQHGGIERLVELEAENERLTKELAHAKEQWEFRAELAFVMKGERDDAQAKLAALRLSAPENPSPPLIQCEWCLSWTPAYDMDDAGVCVDCARGN